MSFFRRRPRRRRGSLGTIVNSIKNSFGRIDALVASTNLDIVCVLSVDTPVTANVADVKRGSLVKAIWIEFWYYGLSATDVNNIIDIYLIKNPGTNLTLPNPGTIGTSNEKQWVIREWRGLAGVKSLGGKPYQQVGRWFKIPKRFQRMGTDDTWSLVARSSTTGNLCTKFIYKWYS